MGCCKCEQYKWPDPQKVVWRDEEEDGKEYCVFHAPAKHKNISPNEFNKRIFATIDSTKSQRNNHATCHLEGVIFPDCISFESYDKHNPLPPISFRSASFSSGARFAGSSFTKEAVFSQVSFFKITLFDRAVFDCESTFDGAEFHEDALFHKTVFNRNAKFNDALFLGETDFDSATFTLSTYFNNSTFNKITLFSNSVFKGPAKFFCCSFKDTTHFNRSTFQDISQFDKAVFSSKSYFNNAKFYEKTFFSNTQFNSSPEFNKTTFNHAAYFFHCTFHNGSYFLNCTFFKNTSFYGTHFGGTVIISSCTFKKQATFRQLLFINDIRFQFMATESISNIDLLMCNVSNIRFISITWPKHATQNRYCVRTEYKHSKLEAVAEFYRQMKKRNRDEQNDAEASLWHYAEKEVQLKLHRLEKPFSFQRFMLEIYRFISRYGEDPRQAGEVLFYLLVVLFGILSFGGFHHLGKPPFDITSQRVNNLFLTFAQYALFIKPTWTPPPVYDVFALLFSRLLIPIQAAIFAFALRNKLHR